jgi:hydroxypyruvate reductase
MAPSLFPGSVGSVAVDRETLVGLWRAGIDAVDPADCVRRRLPAGALDGYARIIVIAFGKAATAMASGFTDVLGRDPDDGLAAIPRGSPPPRGLRAIEAGHPIPDEASVRAGDEALRLASAAGPDDLVVCLVSGGGSSLLEAPTVDLEHLRAATRDLLRSGVEITEMNRVRTSMSRIKGGGLARAASRASLLTLLMSDVVGDPVAAIASGPTILDPPHPRHTVAIVGSAADAVMGVMEAARGLSIAAAVATTTMTGEAREVGAEAATRRLPGADIVVYAGETTVTVTGEGRGGRNQEAALAAAAVIAGTDAILLAAGSDGIDGPTDAAGAVVDGETIARAAAQGLDAMAALADNDSHRLLAATGDLIVTGPTGTNVGDLWLACP